MIRSAVASALAWEDIAALVKDAQMRRDPVAMVIHKLKLNEGLITLLLRQVIGLSCDTAGQHVTLSPSVALVSQCTLSFSVPSGCSDPYDSGEEGTSPQPTKVDIDLELTAFANARRCAPPRPHLF